MFARPFAAKTTAGAVDFSVALDEARRVARHPQGGWIVHLARGDSLRAAAVVLSVGHRPPSDPMGGRWTGPRTRFISDPWRPFAMSAIRSDEPVLMFGSGLTAVDAVLSLSEAGRSAPITLVSRRGLSPLAHAEIPPPPVDMEPIVSELLAAPGGVRAADVSRKLREAAAHVAGQGGDWRSVVDGLRPFASRLWQAMPIEERRRFQRGLRPFWEIHRHRMAPSVARRFHSLLDRGKVRLVAGRVVLAEARGDDVHLVLAARENPRPIELTSKWVVNCTGPTASNSAEANPAIGSLLLDGWLLPDELSLGVETTPEGNALDSRRRKVADLFVVGTLRKPALWESTAVRELREQAASVASSVIELVSTASVRGTGTDGKAQTQAVNIPPSLTSLVRTTSTPSLSPNGR